VPRIKTVVTAISKISDRPTNPDAALVVIYGGDLGRKFDLRKDGTVVGRSSKADIQIDQESISRNHAKLSGKGRQLTIEDLGSTNGTYVNDEQIAGQYQLRNGDLIKIGRTIFKFIAGGNIEAAYHDEVYRLTTVDGLTQVFNRRYFEETLEREIARSVRYERALSLVMVDADRFKVINDTHGHLAGDYVLKELAQLINKKIRREDVLSRYGGEEFSLILPEVDKKGALLAAEKLRKAVEKHGFEFDGKKIDVSISCGVAALNLSKAVAAELVRTADEKLFEAKGAGRNRTCA
jgi:diguanylate cyclase (GGDEF)-like protein